ncbi:major facilitator superfamily domain-containing protein [Aspergillus cavernicola]|uniref:Major facilitator superfamily domain-containing protein n=1 Tax=Aspergillus cavernicola TaxID=176166 RepID=A0ABR4IJ21_9EURO
MDNETLPEINVEAQSTFATSTLVADVEKAPRSKSVLTEKEHKTIYGSIIQTSCSRTGCGAVFEAKAKLVNRALLDIGMGRYQWFLFTITSVGWFLDSFWIASFAVINPASANEAMFFLTGDKATYLPVGLFIGLAVGAAAWPWMADLLGRKWIFTSTIVLMGMGGLVGAGMPTFTGLCVVGCVVGIAIAGNQFVGGMILVEMLPASHQFLVCMQGAFWGLGQLVAYAVGWAFIAGYTCGTGPDAVSTTEALGKTKRASSGSDLCHYVANKGWRYVWWTFGCITLFLYLCRFCFPLRETPKHLVARRRDAEATQIVKDIAAYNKRQTWLTEASFARIDSTIDADAVETRRQSPTRAVALSLGMIGFSVLLLLWIVTGLTFVLHKTYVANYLSAKHGVTAVTPTGVSTDYLFSRYLYTTISAIPGPIIAGLLIEAQFLGRKRTGAIIALLTGLFMLLETLVQSPNAALGFNCILSFLEYSALAVLTTYTVEVFPSPVRGSGLAVMGFSWGLFGLIAQIINVYADTTVAGGGPVWFCGAMWIVMVGAWLVLPIETRGRAAA